MPTADNKLLIDSQAPAARSRVRRASLVMAVLALLIAAAWGTLVLVYAGPGESAWGRASVAAVYALGTLASLLWLRPWWRALAVCGLGLGAVLLWWHSLEPSNDRDWQPDVARLAWAEVRGDQLVFHNVRNSEYRSETDFTTRYEDRLYDISKLRGLDMYFSYWSSRAISHTFLSWDFEGTPPLAISIETRKQKGQEYSAFKGFFRQYELIYVAADERDVVRLRTNYRGEEVYLYRLRVTPEQARAMLMDYVSSMNGLVEQPEFYNALIDNCTTTIRRHVKHVDPGAPPIDWRLFVNGYLDELLYERGRVDTALPFPRLRELSHINARAKAIGDDPDFSRRLRQGLPNPRDIAATPNAN